RVASVQQLMDLFRLSPAEARLTRALAQGENVERYADQEGLKRSTIKTQLTSALTKTGMRGQKDLIRLVLDLPAIRPDIKK
ncbi:MAG: helix-turn-helix transcriptional regulator, partial [Zoogloea sp.]|nr:helix-turn-helix transcriptional regulator [Zoogloea sp.]